LGVVEPINRYPKKLIALTASNQILVSNAVSMATEFVWIVVPDSVRAGRWERLLYL
jgi:hypothetical protein